VTPRFGTDGVRGAALTEITTEYVERLGAAVASVLGGRTWLLARDTRASGPELERALAAGLTAAGADVELLGVLPTPGLAHLAHSEERPAAMITASHNPFGDNGVKVFAPGGTKLDDRTEERIESVLAAAPATGPSGAAGRVRSRDDAVERYVRRVVSLLPAAALDGLRVVLDCANGAMSVAAPLALAALGARTTVLHAAPDGRNINAGCGATSPAELRRAVVDAHADLGLAFDGDGDRVIAVDHLGRLVDGDHAIALAALQMHASGELVDDTVVVTVMSNLGFRLAMQRAGITVVETAVGDRYVLEALDAGGLALGGEQSGHIIYRRLATTGDGLLAGVRLADLVRRSGRPLAELADEAMTTYPQVLVNVPVRERHPAVAVELAHEIAAAEARLSGEGRILVRPSGTEALVRVMVEARSEAEAAAVADDLAGVVRHRLG